MATLTPSTNLGDEKRALEVFNIAGSRIVHGKSFPLGLKPKDGTHFDNIDSAATFIRNIAKTGTFRSLLSQHGTILFRGLPVKDASDFSTFVNAFQLPQPHHEVGLAGRRTVVTTNVKTANEEPPDVKFYYHSEYGRSAHFPGVLFFFSELVPEQGGQTPVLSSLELYDRLSTELPQFLKDLREKGVLGRQYFPSKDDPEAEDIGWNWKDSYGFHIKDGDSLQVQREKVESILHNNLQADAEWQPNGSLHVVQRLPAVRRIASTRKPTFFNGFVGVYGRARDNEALEHPYRGIDGKYHLPTTYGDGKPIPIESLERLLQISDEIGFLVPWQPGDVAVVDNYTVQHARTPWKGKRSLLVSLWDHYEHFLPL